MKNLESRKALVNVSIDGDDVLKGRSLIMQPNSSIELERYIDSLDKGYRFKFIRKTEEIAKHRGDRIDDGLVRIEFRFEKPKPVHIDYWYHWNYYPPIWIYPNYIPCTTADVVYTSTGQSQTLTSDDSHALASTSCYYSQAQIQNVNTNEGITVPGNDSYQKFYHGDIGSCEENSYVIILTLKGYTSSDVVIEKPLTVTDKLECPTCGKTSKSDKKFCSNCGTRLHE
jgi:hypothetical protein